MAWFKVDDKLWGHPKWVAASPGARALWVTAGSWCSDQLTDGAIPAHVLGILGARQGNARELVEIGLWETTAKGWQFCDWSDYQPSREHVMAEREAARQRQAKAREAARLKRMSRDSHGVTSPEVPAQSQSPRPDPTRPDPTVVPTELPDTTPPTVGKPARKSKPKSRLPEDYAPSDDAKTWVREHCPGITGSNVDLSTRRFMDHYVNGKGSRDTRADWHNTWQNWVATDWSRSPAVRAAAGTPARSTSDARVADAAALSAKYRAMEQAAEQQHLRLEIA
jgi:hypothetical protein